MHNATVRIRKHSLFALFAGLLILVSAGFTSSAQASPRKVGDRVEAEWKSGLWYTAKIIAIDSGQYKVRYESDGIIQDLPSNRLRPVAGSRPAPQSNLLQTNGKTAVVANGFPVIPGTAWKIDWGIRGANVQVFLFCKSGRWEVVSPMLSSGAVTLMGRYTLSGNNLVTRNMDGREVTNYRMTWKANVLEMDSGKSVMRLHYNGTTACK